MVTDAMLKALDERDKLIERMTMVVLQTVHSVIGSKQLPEADARLVYMGVISACMESVKVSERTDRARAAMTAGK